MILYYKLYVLSAIFFPVQIRAFYAKYRSIYVKVSVLLLKWSALYSNIIVLFHTYERRPVWLLWEVGCGARMKRVA